MYVWSNGSLVANLKDKFILLQTSQGSPLIPVVSAYTDNFNFPLITGVCKINCKYKFHTYNFVVRKYFKLCINQV